MKFLSFNDTNELKRVNSRIFTISTIFAVVAVFLLISRILLSLKLVDSMGGLAMMNLVPFLLMALIFASNTLLYFIFLVYTKITNPKLAAKYVVENSICFFGVMIFFFVMLYYFAESILIILSIWPIFVLLAMSAYYYRITTSLSTVDTSKIIRFSIITILILIIGATASTIFFQYKIKQLRSESNGGVQLSQEINTKDCRIYTLYEHRGSIFSGKQSTNMVMHKFIGWDLSYSKISSQTDYLGSLNGSNTEENIEKMIKDKSISTNNVNILTSYATGLGPYTTLYLNIYDATKDTFSDYVMILAPGQRCSLF